MSRPPPLPPSSQGVTNYGDSRPHTIDMLRKEIEVLRKERDDYREALERCANKSSPGSYDLINMAGSMFDFAEAISICRGVLAKHPKEKP